jgi:hypothetical protein
MTHTILRKVEPLSESPDFVNAFAQVLSDADGMVCQVCGLERLGHGPQSSWLGYARHEWTGVSADADTLKRADTLSRDAYRARCAQNLCGTYCQTTH